MTAPASRYAAAALDREAAGLCALTDGRRRGAFLAAVKVGSLVGAGALSHDEAEARLLDAAAVNERREAVARSAIRRGLRYGEAHPRTLSTRGVVTLDRLAPRTGLIVAPDSRLAARPFPPREEVEALWRACRPIHEDDEVAAWLVSRGLDLDAVALEVEVRALPRTLPAPTWARFGGRGWTASGHRAIFPVYDARGRVVSVRARAVVPVAENGSKSLAPAGHGIRGAVLADHLARRLLAGERPDSWNGHVVVVEGEPNLCAWAANRSDATESTYAVLGIAAGAWTPALAARIPDDATVVLDLDHDAAGDRYAAEVAETFRGSPVRLVRRPAQVLA